MNEQIEEMAIIIAKQNCNPFGCENCDFAYEYGTKEESCEDYLAYRKMAEAFYNACYRKQEWISVEERLPAEDVRVLVWLRKDHKTTYTRIDTDRRLNGVWVRWYESVTHWMPLPEAPKGVAE
jgi:hypothetical protein